MAMTSWCEHCGAIHLEGPFIPQCEKCSPEDNTTAHLHGVALVSAWVGAILGSWAVVGGLLFAVLWVLQ